MGANFDKYNDIIDSRDIAERIAEIITLTEESGSWVQGNGKLMELATLRKLVDEINATASDTAEDGVTLIRDGYFREYAQELADDLGLLPKDYSWPTSCIDWEQAARELRMDYSSVDFDGVTYWAR